METVSRKRQRHRNFQSLLCFKAKCGVWMYTEGIPALLECFIIVEVAVKNVLFCSGTLSFCIQYETQRVRMVSQ